ncbi:MAG: hypothetical protein M1839_004576 [Geoglossum umbratile]|nr:MAG: hypothetical protein M1839_004576 [Geoglossum umbratile]
MFVGIIAGLQLWGIVTSASPIYAESGTHLARRAQLDNTDIWASDGNGHLAPVANSLSPDGTPAPFDILFTSDGSCTRDSSVSPGGAGLTQARFCNQQTAVAYGPAMKVSPDIDCSGLAACSETHTSSFTTTSSSSISGGVDVPLAFQAIKLTARLSGTRTWTDSSTQTDSFTFTPRPNSKGHMVFFPYMIKACGFVLQSLITYPIPNFPVTETITGYDPVACGYTPLILENGQPDGIYSFCDIVNNIGCGN